MMMSINYIQSIPNCIQSIPVNYPILLVPIGCQFDIPNGQVCSGGFIVYYANNTYFL
jgi:hypothetical protein